MTIRRWAAMVSGVVLSVIVAGGLVPATLRAQSKPPAAAPADTSASAAKYQAAMAEWKSKIVPAAKKEGEVIWYSCAQATEAEGTITAFNKAYPDIQVSQVLSPGFQLVEKINTESAAGRVQADVYQCGGQSGRTLSWRGLSEDFVPPTALDPSVKWRWPIMNKETHLAGVFASVSGLNVNTKLVPAEKYPKSYWDLVRDPYWVDLIKRKRVAFTDPRIANIGVYHVYGLKDVNGKDYGEPFIREFAGDTPWAHLDIAGSSRSSSASTSRARWRAASSTRCSAARGASSTAWARSRSRSSVSSPAASAPSHHSSRSSKARPTRTPRRCSWTSC